MYAGVVFALAFTAGFVVMGVELLGGRIMAPYFGSSIYIWGSIITVFLVALSLGYLIGGAWSLRTPSLKRLGLIFLCGAVVIVPVLLAGDAIMDAIFERITDPRYGSLAAAVALFFLPTIVLGMISPYSVRLLVEQADHSGHVAGKLYFVSTLGSALGTLATSFYFVLWFEVSQILIGLISALLIAGVLAMTAPIGRAQQS